jgi:hypothetical protein
MAGFWIAVVIAVAVIVGLSWLAGTMINKRGASAKGKGKGKGAMSRQDAIDAAKVSGAFNFRKENQP